MSTEFDNFVDIIRNFLRIDYSLSVEKHIFCLIVIREVAFVKRNATFVIETQVCNLKCTICK